MRRSALLAGLTAASLLLGACGSSEEKGKPDARPQDVSTEIAPPKPTAAQTFKGQSLSDTDTERLTTTMNASLSSGDKRRFLSVFDPARTDLVKQQATWFDNVRKVPMKVRRMVLVEAKDTRDSSGRSTLTADLGFEHQITGADPVAFRFLGFNSDRSEFWVARDGTDVIRLDTLTGKRVGQGLAAPPMRLVNFGVSGVKSGLNFYRTDAP